MGDGNIGATVTIIAAIGATAAGIAATIGVIAAAMGMMTGATAAATTIHAAEASYSKSGLDPQLQATVVWALYHGVRRMAVAVMKNERVPLLVPKNIPAVAEKYSATAGLFRRRQRPPAGSCYRINGRRVPS